MQGTRSSSLGLPISARVPRLGIQQRASYHAAVSTASTVAAYLALAWAATLAWLAIGAAVVRWALQRRTRALAPVSARGTRVVLVRPCAGAEPGLLDNLMSMQTLESEAELTIVMSVDDPEDGARPVIAT